MSMGHSSDPRGTRYDVADSECTDCGHRIVTRLPVEHRQYAKFVRCGKCGHHNYMTPPDDFVEANRQNRGDRDTVSGFSVGGDE